MRSQLIMFDGHDGDGVDGDEWLQGAGHCLDHRGELQLAVRCWRNLEQDSVLVRYRRWLRKSRHRVSSTEARTAPFGNGRANKISSAADLEAMGMGPNERQ